MTITFESLTTNYGTGVLRTPTHVRGGDVTNYGVAKLLDYAVESSGTSLHMGEGHVALTTLQLKVLGVGAYGLVGLAPLTMTAGASSALSPTVGIGTLSQYDLVVNATGFAVRGGDAVLVPLLRLFATDTSAIGRVALPLSIAAQDRDTEPKKQAILVSSPGALLIEVQADASLPPVTLADGLSFSDGQSYQSTYVLAETIAFHTQFGRLVDSLIRLSSSAGFNGSPVAVLRLLIAEIIGLHDETTSYLSAFAKISERLGLTDDPDVMVQLLALVHSAFALADANYPLDRETIDELVNFAGGLSFDRFDRWLAESAVGFSGAPVDTLLLVAHGSDIIGLGASVFSILSVIQALRDGVALSVAIRLGDEVYTTWVMNAENQGFRQYENYPFNSYARLGEDYYGASDDGIYLLDGDTDDGTPIAARIRTGLMNFGSMLQKRFEKAYMGLATDGTMLLRVYTTSPQGDKVAYTYRMNERPKAVAEEAVIGIGRGLESVYWSFELINENGANFEISDIELLPMTLTSRVRRK